MGDWETFPLPLYRRGINGLCDAFAAAPTGAAFGNYPTNQTLPVNKREADTTLVMRLGATFFVDNANTGAEFAVLLDGIDYSISIHATAGVANDRKLAFGEIQILGPSAGAFTAVVRWRRWNGTGNVFAGGDDYFSLFISEEYFAT